MPLRLKNPNELPKDGYFYIDSNGRRFGGMFSFNYTRNEMSAYRKGNNRPRSSLEECGEDLEAFTINRDPSLGYDTSISYPEQVRQTKPAGCCGGITIK